MPELDVSESLKTMIFEEGITHIGDYLCYNYERSMTDGYMTQSCTNLESISLPSTLKSIGKYAFADCDQLAAIIFRNEADDSLTFYENAFYTGGWVDTYIRVPNVLEINPYLIVYDWAGQGRGANFSSMDGGPFEITGIDGDISIGMPLVLSVSPLPEGCAAEDLVWSVSDETVARIAQDGVLTFLRAGYATVSVMIPDTDLQIEANLECEGTQILQLPAMLTLIEQGAFEGCSAEIIVIPYSVEHVESRAFANCPYLYKVAIENPATIIDEGAFEGSDYATVLWNEVPAA